MLNEIILCTLLREDFTFNISIAICSWSMMCAMRDNGNVREEGIKI